MPIIAPLHYHPCISYFAALSSHDSMLVEAAEHYQKQSYRNRCHILTAQGVKPLVVPVKHTSPKIPIREVEIDNSQRWAGIHWRSIQSAYGSAPYFVYYADAIKEVYDTRHDLLFDLNLDLLKKYLKLLYLDIDISFTSEFRTNYPPTIVDSRNLAHPKTMPGNFVSGTYVQVFGDGFEPNLSILDALFNLGPEAGEFLRRSAGPA